MFALLFQYSLKQQYSASNSNPATHFVSRLTLPQADNPLTTSNFHLTVKNRKTASSQSSQHGRGVTQWEDKHLIHIKNRPHNNKHHNRLKFRPNPVIKITCTQSH